MHKKSCHASPRESNIISISTIMLYHKKSRQTLGISRITVMCQMCTCTQCYFAKWNTFERLLYIIMIAIPIVDLFMNHCCIKIHVILRSQYPGNFSLYLSLCCLASRLIQGCVIPSKTNSSVFAFNFCISHLHMDL